MVSKINFLGDAVVFLPTLKALSDFFVEDRISVLCTAVGRQVFEGCGSNLDFMELNSRNGHRTNSSKILYAIKAFCRMKPRSGYSFSLHSYDEPSVSYLMAVLLRIPKRIGYSNGIAKGQCLLSEKIAFNSNRNVVDINFDLYRHISGYATANPKRVAVAYTPQDSEYVSQYLNRLEVKPGAPFIIVHPGAKLPHKRWPAEWYSKLAFLLESRLRVPVLVLMERDSHEFESTKRITGLSIKRVASLLKRATLFIGNNSGPMHLAASMGTPSVVIQGPSASNWDLFWMEVPHHILRAANLSCQPCETIVGGQNAVCSNAQSPAMCMRSMSVDAVQEAVFSLVASAGLQSLFKQ